MWEFWKRTVIFREKVAFALVLTLGTLWEKSDLETDIITQNISSDMATNALVKLRTDSMMDLFERFIFSPFFIIYFIFYFILIQAAFHIVALMIKNSQNQTT
jgi:hypothetical protein